MLPGTRQTTNKKLFCLQGAKMSVFYKLDIIKYKTISPQGPLSNFSGAFDRITWSSLADKSSVVLTEI